MLSVLVFYRHTRRALFDEAWKVLGPIFTGFDKILCCDGPSDVRPDEFSIVEVERPGTLFNWAKVWEAGLAAAKNDLIFYLDCDRFFDPEYLDMALSLGQIDDFSIVYPTETYRCFSIDKEWARQEPRMRLPLQLGQTPLGKNPLSGNTVFHKRLFQRLGGFDPTFEGYGYADTDFFMKAWQAGVNFRRIDIPEYHLAHETEVDPWTHLLMSIYNCRKFCRRYNVEPSPRVRHAQDQYMLGDEVVDRFNSLEAFIEANPEIRPIML